jgi:hypothetical protein
MRSCKEISVLLSEAQERPLGPLEQWSVRLHLLICKGCNNFRAQLAFLRVAVRRYRDGGDGR